MAGDAKRPKFSDEMDRRKFIGVAAVTAGAMLLKPALGRGTAANSAVRVGLLGCGGRGTGDAADIVGTDGARRVVLAAQFQGQTGKPQKKFAAMHHAQGHVAVD